MRTFFHSSVHKMNTKHTAEIYTCMYNGCQNYVAALRVFTVAHWRLTYLLHVQNRFKAGLYVGMPVFCTMNLRS